jgi:hypothetical protein
MLRVSKPDFAALVDVEGDLAEVHVVERLVERELVAADRGDRASLGLPGIEIRRREHDLVADAPARGVQHLDRRAACSRGVGQLRPGVGSIAVQVQCAARDHDAAITHAGHDVFVGDGVGEGDRRVARVRVRFAADGQLAVQHDPLGGQLEIGSVREGELAVDRETAERRRTDVEDHVLVSTNDDLVACDRHLAVGPGVRIGPVGLCGRRRLGLRDSAHAAEQDRRNQRCKKDRARTSTHGDTPRDFLNCLSAYHNAGLSIQRAKLIPANALGGGRDY